MDEDRLIDLLIALHDGLPRQGPGDLASTSRALALCTELPTAPDILDIGCGTGAQTLTLAAATTGRITALDLYPAFSSRCTVPRPTGDGRTACRSVKATCRRCRSARPVLI